LRLPDLAALRCIAHPEVDAAIESSTSPLDLLERSSMSDSHDLTAGDFSAWMTDVQAAISGQGESEVPCGACTACCTASQFIHIGPDETDTLAHIPAGVLFPAPRLPRGHVLMGYDERGHCPMLIEDECSIYAHRPRTCRTYDCRVFPAAGIEPDDDKPLIAKQASRWTFSYSSDDDRTQHDAVRASALYLRKRQDVHPDGNVPANATQLAVAAIEAHAVFLARDERTGRTTVVDPEPDSVRVALSRRT
jgi:Fe-S-cluster containining protein